jgi:hypothetical protein
MDLHSFSETKYLCVSEHGPTNEHRLILTYFEFANDNLIQLEDARYESSEEEYTYDH